MSNEAGESIIKTDDRFLVHIARLLRESNREITIDKAAIYAIYIGLERMLKRYIYMANSVRIMEKSRKLSGRHLLKFRESEDLIYRENMMKTPLMKESRTMDSSSKRKKYLYDYSENERVRSMELMRLRHMKNVEKMKRKMKKRMREKLSSTRKQLNVLTNV